MKSRLCLSVLQNHVITPILLIEQIVMTIFIIINYILYLVRTKIGLFRFQNDEPFKIIRMAIQAITILLNYYC